MRGGVASAQDRRYPPASGAQLVHQYRSRIYLKGDGDCRPISKSTTNGLVLSVDEKTQRSDARAPERLCANSRQSWVNAYKSTNKWHGTLNLFAALYVATGEIKGQTTQTKTRDDFRQFMTSIIRDEPPHREIHVILDNYCSYKSNDDWLATLRRPVYFNYTPTLANWLNQIEIWFGILSRKALKQASFTSTNDLKNAIDAFINMAH